MSHNIRVICPEKSSDIEEELQAMQIPLQAWKEECPPIEGYGVIAENLEEEHTEVLRRECLARGMRVYLAHSDGARRKTLLWGNRRQLEEMAGDCLTMPILSGIGAGLERSLTNLFQSEYRFRCGDYTLPVGRKTLLMGALNVTPDSFSDGGKFLSPEAAIARGQLLMEEGADILDIGGESSRPGSQPIDAREELARILPPLRSLVKMGIPISVDTCKSGVARIALQAGASLINDISGLRLDPALAEVVAQAGAGLVIMHMKGTPQDMQKSPRYDCLMGEIMAYLQEGITLAESAGVGPDAIAVDPGLGFGKDLGHNLTLLRRLRELKCLGKPILVGPSRKSFIGRILDLPVDDRVEGTAAAVGWAICKGASMVRVHDVREMKRVALMVDTLRDGN